jgi:hypothetical protein
MADRAKQLTAVGWVIAVSLQVNAGLGRHVTAMTAPEIVRYQQVRGARSGPNKVLNRRWR